MVQLPHPYVTIGKAIGEGNGNPLLYSCLENPMDRGAWQATVHGDAKSQTWLSDFTPFLPFLTVQTFVSKVMSLLFNMLSWSQLLLKEQGSFIFMAVVTVHSDFRTQEIESVTVSSFSPYICHEVMGPDAMILAFWMLSFKSAFSLSSFTFIKSSSVPLHFLPLEWYHLHICSYWYFS